MGLRGPAPTPTAVLNQRGSWRGKKNKSEPRPAKKTPLCPKWFDKDRRAVWKQLIPVLTEMGVLTRIDGWTLERYCDAMVRWRQTSKSLSETGEVYVTARDDKGKPKCVQQLPQVSICSQLAALLAQIETQFGMTPSARTRITVEVPKEPTKKGLAALRLNS
jgi:P27 family predicted phage terminase small subunit